MDPIEYAEQEVGRLRAEADRLEELVRTLIDVERLTELAAETQPDEETAARN